MTFKRKLIAYLKIKKSFKDKIKLFLDKIIVDKNGKKWIGSDEDVKRIVATDNDVDYEIDGGIFSLFIKPISVSIMNELMDKILYYTSIPGTIFEFIKNIDPKGSYDSIRNYVDQLILDKELLLEWLLTDKYDKAVWENHVNDLEFQYNQIEDKNSIEAKKIKLSLDYAKNKQSEYLSYKQDIESDKQELYEMECSILIQNVR